MFAIGRSVMLVVTMVAALSYSPECQAEGTEVSQPSFALIPAGAAALGLGVYLNLNAAAEFRDGNNDCLKLFSGCGMKSLSGGILVISGVALAATYGGKVGERHASLGEAPPGALSQGALVLGVLGFATAFGAGIYSIVEGIGCADPNGEDISSGCAGGALFKAAIVQSVGQVVMFAAAPFSAYRLGFKVYRHKTSPLVFLPMAPAGGGVGLVSASRF